MLQNFGSIGLIGGRIQMASKKSSVLNECIIFGFQVIQMLYAKYYIYIQHLYHNNKLDLFSYLSQLKYAMEVEYKVCKSQNNENDIYEV